MYSQARLTSSESAGSKQKLKERSNETIHNGWKTTKWLLGHSKPIFGCSNVLKRLLMICFKAVIDC